MSMFKRFATLFARYKEFEKWRKYAGTCAIGDILLNEMDDPKSPNYIELIFTDKDGKEQAIVTVVRASGKTPAKMLEEANERLDLAENSLKAAGFTQASPSNQWKPPVGPSASPLLQRIDDLSAQRDELLVALEMMLEIVNEPPEANCSCHICAPCGDCVEHSGEREAFELAKYAVAKAKGGAA